MRILLAHNFYRSNIPSGENQVFEVERDLLMSRGHDVAVYSRSSDEISKRGKFGEILSAVTVPWNPFSARTVAKKINKYCPDVVHVHNTFPLISPSIFKAIGKKAARILTLHNYRLLCPAAIPMRSGKVCTECIDNRSASPSVKYGCYRDSRFATLPLAINVDLHRWLGTWTKEVDAFVALSEFQKNLIAKAGIPDNKVHVKPNFYPGNPSVKPWFERKDFMVFVGRLSAEKGVFRLIEAWKNWGAEAPWLYMIGDGPLRTELERMAVDLPIKFFGQMSTNQAQEKISEAKLLILPSECFEGFPMVIREAFAFGTPVAVSDIGPLPSIVENGVSGIVFPVADSISLFNKIKELWFQPSKLIQMAKNARLQYEEKYDEKTNYNFLMGIYEAAIRENRKL